MSVDLPAFGRPSTAMRRGLARSRLAAVFLFAKDQRLGLALLVRVETRRGRQDFDQRVVEFA
jgi:hypothetical protein